MKDQKFLFILGFVLAVAAMGVAQDVPKIELAGGYSYVNFLGCPQLLPRT